VDHVDIAVHSKSSRGAEEPAVVVRKSRQWWCGKPAVVEQLPTDPGWSVIRR
jgi:hypothetical protein